MNKREIMFGLIGVIGTIFAFWAFWYERPSREISYFHMSGPLFSVEALGSTELSLDGHRITEGTIYKNRLFIWNSGNLELASEDFGEPVEWSNAAPGILLSGLPTKIDSIFHGIRADQVEGEILPGFDTGGIRFKKLYPGTGLELTFLTRVVPDISLSGSVSGNKSGSGVVRKVRVYLIDMWLYILGIWLIIFLAAILHSWRTEKPNGFVGHVSFFFGLSLFSLLPTMLLFVVYITWFNAFLPPF